VLVAGDDAILIDFEGEPLKPLAERRARNAPLRAVAGMLRSFDYVEAVATRSNAAAIQERAANRIAEVITLFHRRLTLAFLTGYTRGRGAPLSPQDRRLIDVFRLEKAAYEIDYEASNRPDWLAIPLEGFARIAYDLLASA